MNRKKSNSWQHLTSSLCQKIFQTNLKCPFHSKSLKSYAILLGQFTQTFRHFNNNFIHSSIDTCVSHWNFIYFFFLIIFFWSEIICRNYSTSIILCNVERKMNFNNEKKVKFQSMSSSVIIIVSLCSRRWECRKNLNWLYRRRMSLHSCVHNKK